MGVKKQDFSNWWFGSSVRLERVTADQLREEIEEEKGEEMDREELLHWVEYNPRLIQDTLIRMIEIPIENRASPQLDGEELVRNIVENAHRFLKLNNI